MTKKKKKKGNSSQFITRIASHPRNERVARQSVVNSWRKPSSNYLTGEIQGKQTILEVFKCEESVQRLERFSM